MPKAPTAKLLNAAGRITLHQCIRLAIQPDRRKVDTVAGRAKGIYPVYECLQTGAERIYGCLEAAVPTDDLRNLDWLIAGSESGNDRRPAKLAWFRDARDQCQRLGVRFFFKQWLEGRRKVSLPMLDGRKWCELPAGSEAI